MSCVMIGLLSGCTDDASSSSAKSDTFDIRRDRGGINQEFAMYRRDVLEDLEQCNAECLQQTANKQAIHECRLGCEAECREVREPDPFPSECETDCELDIDEYIFGRWDDNECETDCERICTEEQLLIGWVSNNSESAACRRKCDEVAVAKISRYTEMYGIVAEMP